MVLECAKQNLQKCYYLPNKFILIAGMPPLALVYGVALLKAATGICLLHFFLLHLMSYLLAWLAIHFLCPSFSHL